MSIFRRLDHGRAKVGPAGDVDGRLTPGQSAIVIVVLSVLVLVKTMAERVSESEITPGASLVVRLKLIPARLRVSLMTPGLSLVVRRVGPPCRGGVTSGYKRLNSFWTSSNARRACMARSTSSVES